MNISDFIGKSIKEIAMEGKVQENAMSSTLIIFDDGSKVYIEAQEGLFFTSDGNNVIDDIERVSYSEFWKKL
jgi:hypothetical protein